MPPTPKSEQHSGQCYYNIREAALQMQITKQEIETMIQQAVLAGKAAADTSAKDFYKATERRLYALETLRAKIAEDKGRLEEIKKYGPAQRSKGIGRFMKTGVRLTPDEIQEAVVCDMEATIAADEYEVETMDNALAKIAGDFYYKAVSGKYMEGLSDDQVAAYLNCDVSTAWRNRKRLVQKLSVWLYGAAASK
nr:MAG TPA: Protein of unknown function (DUF722) [Bacteriophage sp.]